MRYLLGIVLLMGIAIIAFLSYVSPLEKTTALPFQKVTPEASFSFENDTVFPASRSAVTSSIIISSNAPVKSAQIDLSYNPAVIHNLTISPSENNFFGDKNSYQITLLEVREDLGRATLAIEILPNVSEKVGEGAVATLSFQAIPFILDQTEIEFLNKSTIMTKASRESILKTTGPLKVIFRNMNTPTNQSTASPVLLEN